jgi:hypothetical protein
MERVAMRDDQDCAPWETLPGDVIRIILGMLVDERQRRERPRYRDFVALKNTCHTFLRAAERMEQETVAISDAMRHHQIYKKHWVRRERF